MTSRGEGLSKTGGADAGPRQTRLRPERGALHEREFADVLKVHGAALDLSSIDAIQGRENDVVALSLVRTAGRLGFSDDARRINVALTRARCGLIVIGHGDTLRTSPVWSEGVRE
eukprot:GHVU01123942.1.p2 GENE.GHVU01123942.1~~GHVU01123942.1.p2  ORF type:complete len:115 (-),score=13.23 GHVU01123942.1:45-389(-)